ncbi:MAG: GGDEF domain-containing protein [Thermodesulfobacterium sp.]|nr:GGDEF domain-containing protein [Thermodesulfobacterium sp.]
MRVKDVMKADPVTLKLDDRIEDIFEAFKKYDIGSVIIVEKEKPFQIITLRDLPRICYLNLYSNFISNVLKVLDKNRDSLITVYYNKSFFDALGLMNKFKISHLPVVDRRKRLVGILSIRDIAKKFPDIFYIDPLTKVNNRAFLNLLSHRLSKVNSSVSFLMIDIDNFKNINDKFGHVIGDKVLQKLGKVLRSNVKITDEVIRYGGEEFLVIAYRCDLEDAKKLGERLRKSVEKIKMRELSGVKITVSIGISLYNKNEDVLEVIEQADRAMYEAKKLGKNRVCIYLEEKLIS